ncbi:hypothetical protein Q7472_10475 [Glaesserella parasuis]|uniref:hypothetical protein n=1 Tax=Glaesserella parasuis TaxID=738 RepID=UPI002436F3CB|nr:hypothetical protein [Glaesserella parasuis]MDE4018154.1 hypothetical protein [Glaesserella parasuis]MDO9674523.1 hypothetical protein [Glaesserella parasuis]MDO9993570.1 hypothetical protein [Glaesserella parasuis]MDP0101550.1 hypothetical protein [Glaesserella parasuis]
MFILSALVTVLVLGLVGYLYGLILESFFDFQSAKEVLRFGFIWFIWFIWFIGLLVYLFFLCLYHLLQRIKPRAVRRIKGIKITLQTNLSLAYF